MQKRWAVVILALAMLTVVGSPAAAGQKEYVDVLNQDGSGAYTVDGASLNRTPNGLNISLSMPAPEPGTYVYAEGTAPGHPEVFTGWAFIFNHPEECLTNPCGLADLGGPANASIYNFAGHAVGGTELTLSGRITIGQTPAAFGPLTNPDGAEVHVAIAPHGALDPATLPAELRTPVGSPVCGCWWVALFLLP